METIVNGQNKDEIAGINLTGSYFSVNDLTENNNTLVYLLNERDAYTQETIQGNFVGRAFLLAKLMDQRGLLLDLCSVGEELIRLGERVKDLHDKKQTL